MDLLLCRELIKSMFIELNNTIYKLELSKDKNISCIQIFNNQIYIGTHNSKVYVSDMTRSKSDKELIELSNERNFYPHCDSVHLISVSDQYIIVVAREQQQLIRIWNRQTLQILHGYKGHQQQISSVIFLKDGKNIASISHDGTARIWQLSENFEFDTEKKKFTNKYPLISVEQFDEQSIIFGGDDCFISVWNWHKNTIRLKCFAHPGSVLCLSLYFPYLISAGGDSKIKLWKIFDGEQNQSLLNKQQILNPSSKINLVQQKEFKQNLSQNLWSTKLSDQLIVADSRGNIFTMNRNLEFNNSKILLDYTETIKNLKIWQNFIVFTSNIKAKGELKYMGLKFAQPIHCEPDISEQAEQVQAQSIKTNTIKINQNPMLGQSIEQLMGPMQQQQR